jgi:hypothetical protein
MWHMGALIVRCHTPCAGLTGMRLGVDLKSLLSARQATQGDMESRKLYWIVLSGIALILLAIA